MWNERALRSSRSRPFSVLPLPGTDHTRLCLELSVPVADDVASPYFKEAMGHLLDGVLDFQSNPNTGGKMAAPRAFISFEMEDRWARDFIVQHAKDEKNDISFYDYSVQDAFDSKWKTECAKRIALTKGTIVMVGATTGKSEAVLWEIAETIRQGHYLFGIQINKDKTHPIPAGLPSSSVIRWDFEQIASWLKTWV